MCSPGSQAKKVDNYKCTFYTCVWKSLDRWWLWALKISNIDATSADSFVSSFSKLVDKFSSLFSTALRELQQSLHTGGSLCSVPKSDAFRELVSSVWKLCEWLLKPDEALFSLLISRFFVRACPGTHGFKSYPQTEVSVFDVDEVSSFKVKWFGIFKLFGLGTIPSVPNSALLFIGPFEFLTFCPSCQARTELESFADGGDFCSTWDSTLGE